MKNILNTIYFLIILFLLINIFSCNRLIKTKKIIEPINLKIIWWGGQSRHDKTLKVIQMFENENPDIKIDPIYLGWRGYWEKLATLVASNDIPDIVQMVIQRFPQYIEKDLLADIRDIKTINLDDVDKTAIDFATINGKLYGITLGYNAMCLAYDKEMLEKAQVDLPNPKWTWVDFERAVIKIHNKLGIYGVGQIAGDYNNFDVFLRENGQSRFSKDTKKVGFSEKIVADFLNMALRLERSGAMEPIKIYSDFRSNEEDSMYARDKCAMSFLWSNLVNAVYNIKKKVSDLTIYPGPNNNKGAYINPSMFFSVSKSSKFKEQSGRFIDFFINNTDANIILNAERGVPVVSNVRKSLIGNLDFQNKKIFDYIEFVNKYSIDFIDTTFPAYEAETREILERVFEQVLYGKLTPEQGAKKLIDECNKVLAK